MSDEISTDELPTLPHADAPTAPETPVAKAAAAAPASRWALVRIVVIDGLLLAGLCWASYIKAVSWEVPLGFIATVLLTQAKPSGSTLETAVKAIAGALSSKGTK